MADKPRVTSFLEVERRLKERLVEARQKHHKAPEDASMDTTGGSRPDLDTPAGSRPDLDVKKEASFKRNGLRADF
ncbi:hypothetical protein T484DRAFT_1838273 [Baffinella frigidus]|nr:hypothetical protein T484DRAFT_1838273 [Cryptophyta sp. CCMP2293]